MGFTFCSNANKCMNYYCDKRLSQNAMTFIKHRGIHIDELPFTCIQERRIDVGTNYYLMINICEKCGKPETVHHIGKSSCGWKFVFNKQKGLEKFEDLPHFLTRGRIFDEYGREITIGDLLKKIEKLQENESSFGINKYVENINGYDFLSDEPCPKYSYDFNQENSKE